MVAGHITYEYDARRDRHTYKGTSATITIRSSDRAKAIVEKLLFEPAVVASRSVPAYGFLITEELRMKVAIVKSSEYGKRWDAGIPIALDAVRERGGERT